MVVCPFSIVYYLTGLEEENGNLSKVEVDKMLRFVCDVASKVSADDCVPRWVVLLVELFLDVGCDVLFDVVLLHGLGSTVMKSGTIVTANYSCIAGYAIIWSYGLCKYV